MAETVAWGGYELIMQTINKPWTERFDDEFADPTDGKLWPVSKEEVKSFITTLLAHQREEILDEVLAGLPEEKDVDDPTITDTQVFTTTDGSIKRVERGSFNAALSQVKDQLMGLKK